jgi:3-oxoadipate enol-lactonase
MPTASADGISIYYEVHGAGDPLLLIGGLGSDITLFGQLIPVLAAHHQVVALDNRGAGRSDKPDIRYSVAMMAGDAVAVLDALGIETADILGVSMGGKIALEIALTQPARVRRLVLVSSSAAPRTGKMTLSWPMRLAQGFAKVGLLQGKYPQPDYAFRRQREASGEYDALSRLGSVAVPVLIAHGRQDKTTAFARAEELQAGIPDSQLAEFRGGHMFFLMSERKTLADRIDRFLSAQPSVQPPVTSDGSQTEQS